MLILFLILFPLVGCLFLMLLKHKNPRWIATTVSAVEWIASLLLLKDFTRDASVQFGINLPWMTSLGMNFSVGVDGISLLLVLLTTTLVPLIVISSFNTEQPNKKNYLGLIFLMQSALVGVFCAQDGLLFYLFWEMALIPIYFICLMWGGVGRGPITLKFFIYTLAGSLLMLIALVYLYLQTPGTHSFDLQSLYMAGRYLSPTEQTWVFWGLFLAFAIKMPVFPFHTWQPDTYSVAPAQGTMLLSGIMLKMGIYGVLRWIIPVVPAAVEEWGFTAIVLSTIGIVYASCIALIQKDMKRLIAYSSIAHVGLISAGLLTGTVLGAQGAMIQMLSHGIVVVGLFFIVEIISTRTQTTALESLGGIRTAAPKLTSVFIIVMLGSVALPLTSGFIGEFLLINSLFQYNAALGIIGGLTIILGAVYMLTMFQRSMSGEPTATSAAFADLTFREKFVLYAVVIMVIAIGVYPSFLMDISEPAVTELIQSITQSTAGLK
jgi:NADH-quinone oxidoreductase subunit M